MTKPKSTTKSKSTKGTLHTVNTKSEGDNMKSEKSEKSESKHESIDVRAYVLGRTMHVHKRHCPEGNGLDGAKYVVLMRDNDGVTLALQRIADKLVDESKLVAERGISLNGKKYEVFSLKKGYELKIHRAPVEGIMRTTRYGKPAFVALVRAAKFDLQGGDSAE